MWLFHSNRSPAFSHSRAMQSLNRIDFEPILAPVACVGMETVRVLIPWLLRADGLGGAEDGSADPSTSSKAACRPAVAVRLAMPKADPRGPIGLDDALRMSTKYASWSERSVPSSRNAGRCLPFEFGLCRLTATWSMLFAPFRRWVSCSVGAHRPSFL